MQKWTKLFLLPAVAVSLATASKGLSQAAAVADPGAPAANTWTDSQHAVSFTLDSNGQNMVFTSADGKTYAVAPAAGDGQAGVWMARGSKKEKAAFLGVVATPADAAMRDQLKLPRGIGLVIQQVTPDGPAAQAGLQEHDVITKLDDQWLVNSPQLGVLVRMHKPGEEVTLTAIRQGDPITLKAKLIEKEVVINDDGQAVGLGGNYQFAIPDVQTLPQLRGLLLDGDDAALVIRENEVTLKVSVKNGERHLVATDKDGQVLFDGAVETEDQRKALPADIADMLEKNREQFDQVKEGGGRRVRIIRDGGR